MRISVTKDLGALRVGAHAEIDAAATRARERYLTPGTGMESTYREKVEEARALKAARAGDPAAVLADADYPMLAAGRDARIDSGTEPSATLAGEADSVLAQRTAWLAVGAAIDRARLTAKNTVNLATTPAAIAAAVDAATTQLDQL